MGNCQIVLLLVYCVTFTSGTEDIRSVIQEVSSLQSHLLESIIPSYIESEVEQALAKILGDQNVYERVRSLKHNERQMKRRFHVMERRLEALEQERDHQKNDIETFEKTYNNFERHTEELQRKLTNIRQNVSVVGDSLSYVKEIMSNMNESSMEMRETLGQLIDMSRKSIAEIQTVQENVRSEFNNATKLNKTNFNNITVKLNQHINSTSSRLQHLEGRTNNLLRNMSSLRSDVERRFRCIPQSRCVSDQRNRLLAIMLWSDSQSHKQINIHNGIITTYPYLSTPNLDTAAYDPTSKRLLYSTYSPDRIYSSRLDMTGVKLLVRDMKTYGMRVDVERKLVFLTTAFPRSSVSRMDTRGKNFYEIVDLAGFGTIKPLGIDIDSKEMMIYFCKGDRVASVDYEGRNLRLLETGGEGMGTVAFDPVLNSLFFSRDDKVMKKSLLTGETTEIATLYPIWKMILYNRTLYVSGLGVGTIDVLQVGDYSRSTFDFMNDRTYDIMMTP